MLSPILDQQPQPDNTTLQTQIAAIKERIQTIRQEAWLLESAAKLRCEAAPGLLEYFRCIEKAEQAKLEAIRDLFGQGPEVIEEGSR